MKYFLMVMLFPLMVTAQILRPNLIINGDLSLDQRGSATTPTLCSANDYGPDRFKCFENAATGVAQISQTDVVAGTAPYILGLQKSAKTIATTGFTFGAAERVQSNTYNVEGFDLATIAQKTATLSFWVKSKKTGAACVSVRNNGANRSFIGQYTIASADTWQEVSIPINFNTGTASGTWNYTNASGVSIVLAGAFGTDFDDGVAGSWVSTNELGTAACQANNLFAATNDYVEITGVRLTEGAQKVPFVRAGGGTYAAELALAQRYTQVYAVSGSANARILPVTMIGLSATTAQAMFQLSRPMRTNQPSLTTTGTAGDYGLRDFNGTGTTTLSAVPTSVGSANTEHTDSVTISGAVASGLTAGAPYALVATGTARTYLIISAEL